MSTTSTADGRSPAPGPPSPSSTPRRRRFYGWPLLGAGFLLYGLGTPTVSHSWTFFAPEIADSLGLSRAGSGLAYGTFVLASSLFGPVAGALIARFGLRLVMSIGYLLSALGLACTGAAGGFLGLALSFGLLVGCSRSMATILPTQTLASNWFVRYRSRALAAMLVAGGVFGKLMYVWNAWLLGDLGLTWRHGWWALAALHAGLALFAWLAIRDTPESIGQLPDGVLDRDQLEQARPRGETANEFTPAAAMRTPHFWLLLFCGFGYSLPWFAVSAHGRLHLEDVGLSLESAALVLGWMALITVAGRLSGAFGDWIPSERLLGIALLIEAAGTVLFLRASDERTALVALLLFGLGFGAAYIAAASTLARFFGRRAFAPTLGVRLALSAPIIFATPALTGWAFDRTGSYVAPFVALALIGVVGALVALTIRVPQPRTTTD